MMLSKGTSSLRSIRPPRSSLVTPPVLSSRLIHCDKSSYKPADLQHGSSPSHQLHPDYTAHAKDQAQKRIKEVDASTKRAFSFSPFLRDRQHRQHTYLRMSLTERCNLRCLYCMPEDGVPLTPKGHLLNTDEVQRLASLFVNQGVNKIRLTGGEPSVRRDLIDIIASLNDLRPQGLQQIGITSNGISLARKLDSLVASGLTHLNISLDTLDPFKFEFMTRRRGFEAVIKAIDRALELGVQSLKLNVVVIRGLNDGQDVLDFIEYTKDRSITVRFIEYMPFDGNKWQVGKLVPYQDLIKTIQADYPHFGRVAERDDANDTSKHWQVKGHKGTVGFITSMTEHFCGTCNRLRITADGNLKVCLFGNAEVSLRDAMRQGFVSPSPLIPSSDSPATDDQLLHIIGAAVGRKHAKHAGMKDPNELAKSLNRPMITIGDGHATRSTPQLARRCSTLFGPQSSSQHVRLPSTVRAFSSSSFRSRQDPDDDSPWGELDSAFEKLSKQPTPKPRAQSTVPKQEGEMDFETAIFAQAGAAAVSMSGTSNMASMLPANQMQSPTIHQSWSEYMGAKDGDDSPWASLDAFADSWTVAVPMPAHGAARSTPRFHEVPQSQKQPQYSAAPPSVQSAPAYTSPLADQPRLTHIEPATGRASMVDVGHKASTNRSATAAGRVYIPAAAIVLIRQCESGDSGSLTKGPVLHTAQLAGIMAAKRTSELIPLCHSLSLSHVDVKLELVEPPWSSEQQEGGGFTLDQLQDPDTWGTLSAPSEEGVHQGTMGWIEIRCTASTIGQTGVEMEALTGCTIACLTIWDMIKAVAGKEMVIGEVKVVAKSGGKSGDWRRLDSHNRSCCR